MTAIIFLNISAALLFVAAFLSLRLGRITGRWQVWGFIALAMLLMGIRRSMTMFEALSSYPGTSPSLWIESIVLIISVLMVGGVLFSGPHFRRTEEANRRLQQRELQLAEAQKTARLGVFVVDFQNESVWWSDELYRRYGIEKDDEVPGDPKNFNLIHDDDKARLNEMFDEFRASRINEEVEVEYRTHDMSGREMRVHTVFTPIKDLSGKNTGIRGVSQDITERKAAEEALRRSEETYRLLVRNAPYCIHQIDLEGRLTSMNPAGLQMMNLKDELEIQGMPYLDMVDMDDKTRVDSLLDCALQGQPCEFEFGAINGRNYFSSFIPIRDDDDEVIRLMGMTQDITERKQAEEAMRTSEERFRVLYDNNPIILFTIDEHMQVLSVNQFGVDQLGYSRAQLVGSPVVDLFYKDDRLLAAEYLKKCFAEPDKVHNWELRKVRENGSVFYVREMVRAMRDKDGDLIALIVCEDITEAHQLSEKLSYQASHDALTNLVNRRGFERRLERVLETIKRDESEHALCYLDLDKFKVVNDTCGHIAGDELLRQLSMVLQKEVRKRDTLARLGGDEFGILMEHCPLDQAHRVVSDIQKKVQQFQFSWEGRVFRVGVSVGLVPITPEVTDVTELLKRADSACYMAKDQGRNRVHVYRPADASIVQRHGEMQWVTRLYETLEEGRFCLYMQEVVSLDGSAATHYEMLLRMRDEEGNIIPPGAFLPAAERYNLIAKLDYWVIEQTFRLLALHPLFLNHVEFVSINLSGQSLTEESFQKFITVHLLENNISPEKICFEITETAAITNLHVAMMFISEMKVLGCRFALDDFGSGLSSFGYLKNMDVDFLKIDGMFVRDIIKDPIDHAMVKSINDIGQVMGMLTIAEFVETDEIRKSLREIGVDYAQGFGISKPQPVETVLINYKDN